MIDYKPTLSSEPIDYDDVQKLLHKMIDNDFYIYMSDSIRPYACSAVHEKGSILKDACENIMYWGPEHKYIIIKDSDAKNAYYAVENLIEDDIEVWNPFKDEYND